MYIPESNRTDDLEAMHALMMRYNFATLVCEAENRPWATHLPFLLDPTSGERGTLVAHMARANPQWKSFDGSREAMVIFLGPHSYISPAWYRNQATVPTWNYAAVHAGGTPRLIEDGNALRRLVERLVRYHESQVGNPWDVRRAEPVMERELRGIVGFEIPIARLEGKFKFNQNLPAEDRAGVVRALESFGDSARAEVAAIMRKYR